MGNPFGPKYIQYCYMDALKRDPAPQEEIALVVTALHVRKLGSKPIRGLGLSFIVYTGLLVVLALDRRTPM